MDSKKSRRKSASPAATIKSPALAIKRSDEAPVTLKGWLYKQGSEGLQLWKKRWFVLSEYCLFYYKGPNEEKVSGSILLPSYTISPLSKDDGVYRKYAFKAEHANMRTYYFAAETKDSMIQWMNSLSLASILQNETKLRPELLARELAMQGNLLPHLRHFALQHPNQPQFMHQQQNTHLNQNMLHQKNNGFHLSMSPHKPGSQQSPHVSEGGITCHIEGETRQPLYANAPPKPKRLNTSRDYSPSPDNSPERPSHSNFSPNSETNRSEDPTQFRHRVPQERRTPEAYGRSKFDSNPKYPTKDYEEVYNNGYEFSGDKAALRRYSEEVAQYTRDSYASSHDRRMSSGNNASNRNLPRIDGHSGIEDTHPHPQYTPQRPTSDHFPSNHGLPLHNGNIHGQVQERQRVPRPHSADFLEYERTHPDTQHRDPDMKSNKQTKKPQPQRPKSCIGEKVKPDDFWSEEVYAQKMRESAFVYEQSSSRSQSRASQPVRPPMTKSSTMPGFPNDPSKTPNNFYGFSSDSSSVPDQQNFHPLQLSPARNSLHSEPSPNFAPQLPPPAFYQDKSPRDPQLHSGHQHNKSPRSPMQSQGGQFYSPNQSFAGSNSTPHHSTPHQQIPYYNQNSSYQEDQEVANSNARAAQMTPVSHRMTPSYAQHMTPNQTEMYNMLDKFTPTSPNHQNEFYKQQMMQNQISPNRNELHQNQDQLIMQQNQQQMRRTPMHLSPNQSQTMHNQMLQNQHHNIQNQPNNYQPHQQFVQQFTSNRNEFAGMKQEHIQTYNKKDAASNLKHQVLSPDQQVSADMQRMNIHNKAMSPSHQYPPRESHSPQMNENLGYTDNEPKITMPPSFPQPLPRKQSNHTPTMYQNIPPNSKALSDPRPVSSCRLETATPNRLSEKFDSDRSNESPGDFRRSASARLPKHKARVTDYLNNTLNEESDDSKRNSEQVGREESMKRLLEWKQRMLQSPLTRKSSRNASRTQTPTNSDSPVPSINNDDIRKKVLEELQYTEPSTPTQPSKEKRLSRKTSSGSRSSRSRSSPRIAPSKNQIYSSDEEEIGDPRQSRKRTKSQQSARSRNSSKESKRSQSTKSEQVKSRSRSISCTSPNLDQPEYINISTLKSSKESKERDLSWTSKIKPVNAIGPDDWYRDDFDFDKSHPFLDDPMLLKQYAQILDMKYRESSTEKIEEILKQSSLVDQTDLELSMYDPKNSRNKERTKKVRDEDMNRLSPGRHIGHEFSQGRYPDSGYDTLRMDLRGDSSQLCVDIDIEKDIVMRNEPLRKEVGFKPTKDDRKVQSWHSSHFADFQLMEKGEETVFLSIEGHGENLEKAIKRSPRDRDDDKVVWHVGKSYKEIRKEKEAPPKNVVKERLKNFETGQEIPDSQPSLSHNNVLKSTTPTPLEDKNTYNEYNSKIENTRRSESRSGDKFKIQMDKTKNVQKDFEYSDPSSDSEPEFVNKKMEHKKSVKDLLSKFERNSKALDEKDDGYRGIGSYLLRDTRDGGRRRVFSDTETLNYETSSDEEQCDDFLKQKFAIKEKEKEKEDVHLSPPSPPPSAPPPLPPKNPMQSPKTVPESPSFPIHNTSDSGAFFKPKFHNNDELCEKDASIYSQSQEERNQEIQNEDTYLAMTPAKSLSSLPCTPTRKQSQTLLSSAHNSRTSLTSSHGSSQSITSQTLQRFESDKNLGSMTPTEALIHSSTASVNHSRTPSQTLVMEHFHTESGHSRRYEEETYVDMHEDGSYSQTPRMHTREPILAKQCNAKESLDNTLTYESPESPRYCEIEDTTEQSHYEYLCNARTAKPQHYEVVYQEISDKEKNGNLKGNKSSSASKLSRKKEPEPLRPIEGLPDILGNAPTNKGNSSSDADDESSKEFDALETQSQQIITLDDSFRPASFYLSHCKASNNECDDDSSDSDLVSPPPVPSSPPPMEEVLGFTSPNDLDAPNPPDNLSNVLTAAKSAHAMRERSRRNSQEEATRRPSVGSRTSYGSQQSGQHGSQQSLNRDMNMSPQRLHGSHQSLSSRELPPLPNQNLQGSQQSLASKEIQLIGSRNSPYHSREGSLDNEAFLFYKFTQGTSIGENARRPGSDSAEISSSDTANYEQEYRRYHLENIQEVSNTLERTESGSHNTSIISQDLNISYNSVYDSRLQQSKVYKIEEHPVLNKRKSLDERQTQKYFQPDPHSKEIEDEMHLNISLTSEMAMSRPKVPYYVSDIMEDGTLVSSHNDQSKISLKFGEFNDHGDSGSLGMVDVITKSMNALDVESNSYFEDKNQVENERIKMLRRSYTPDPYLTKTSPKEPAQSPVNEGHFESNNVSRSKSLEGLLGDSQGGPKDNIAYVTHPKVYSPHNFNDIPPSSNPKPARGHQPPPPPAGVPPLDIRPLASPSHMMRHTVNFPQDAEEEKDNSVDDEMWAENLRRASMRQRAKSIDNLEENRPKQNVPPPTAPKPKTPVHMMHKEQRAIPSYVQPPVPSTAHSFYNGEPSPGRSPVKRNSQILNQSSEFQFSAHQRPGLASPRHDRIQESYMQESMQQNLYMNSTPTMQEMNRQTPVPTRNSVNRQSNFLEGSLPNPTSDSNDRRTVSRPTSRGPVSPDWMGRQSLSKDTIHAKSMTLPARIKYSQENSPREMNSFDSENSPRTRTSKSGLPEAGDPVPPSPSPVSGNPSSRASTMHVKKHVMQQNAPQINQQSISPPKENAGHQRYKDASEEMTRIRRRNNSTSRKSADLETLKRKFGGNLANITAGDLLGKSQEELVLILIQLRRQSSSLSEAIDACKAELDNIRNMGEQPTGDLRQHTCELEEQLARVIPVINLVDNMVKLGTLYRGSDNTPLSQRMGNVKIPPRGNQASNGSKPNEIQGNLDHSLHALRTQDDTMVEQETFNKQQKLLEKELARVQTQLRISHKTLDESGADMSRCEQDMTALSLEHHNSVQRDMHRGGHSSQNTLSIENDMKEVQQKAMDLQRRRQDMMQQIQQLTQKENLLTNEIRPSPTGVAGAEPIPKKKHQDTWYETDIDNNYTKDWGPETEEQIKKESRVVTQGQDDIAMYVNTYEEEKHNYENYENYEQFKAQVAKNPYEDDVQTIHSEGVRSEMEGPPLPVRPNNHNFSDDDVIIGLGDIGEADERVQRFYGIIPKEKPSEIKTVRMVKRDNKERSSKVKRGNGDEDSESIDLSVDEEEQPPPPLPRGNYQNLHNFLSNQPYETYTTESVNISQNHNFQDHPNRGDFSSRSLPRNYNKSDNENAANNNYLQRSQQQRPNFKLGEYSTSRRPSENSSRPGSALSAHERLFGTSRDESMSPDMSPVKSNSIHSSDSSQSAMMSPIFKSAAARAIIEEERKTPVIIPKAKKKSKKRHMTITSSHPAVLEALNRHDAKMDRTRSRDDMDMERILKPRDAPDVVRSTYVSEFRTNAFDNLFGAPEKINIPERYIPEQTDEKSPEEKRTRLKKADSIRRMLADSSATPVVTRRGEKERPTSIGDDKKQREQILALNQVLARQVMEKSRAVAGQNKEF